tara:strand:+ start:3833 stop:3952 length:120 start_codon:yes stop_codon:yes gene_type:complete
MKKKMRQKNKGEKMIDEEDKDFYLVLHSYNDTMSEFTDK